MRTRLLRGSISRTARLPVERDLAMVANSVPEPGRTAVVVIGTCADERQMHVATASFARHEPGADIWQLMVDASPSTPYRGTARAFHPWDIASYEDLVTIAFRSTPAELVAELAPGVLPAMLRRGYATVFVFRAQAFARAALEPLRAQLASSDIAAAEPDGGSGWWGATPGSHRTLRAHRPGAVEMVTFPYASAAELANAAVISFARLPHRTYVDTTPEASASVAATYRRLLDAVPESTARPYRFGAFSNGVPVDDVTRSALRALQAAGEHYPDPGDVAAVPSLFARLTSRATLESPLSLYLTTYLERRADLEAAFPEARRSPDRLLHFLRAGGAPELDPVWYAPVQRHANTGFGHGIDVVGYFRGELGLGEWGRSFASALPLAGIPHSLLDFSERSLNRNNDVTIGHFDATPRYDIALLCANPDQFDAFDAHPSSAAFRSARYRIGAWWWELDEPAPAWDAGFGRVDELWVGSHFVEDVARRAGRVPVTYIPPIIEPRAVAAGERAEFGLRDDDRAFLFVYDYNSIWERKNPEAAIAAFAEAFPDDARARLIIKAINGTAAPRSVRRLRSLVERDPRISIIDEYFDRTRLIRLILACDAYVSLHRAEGFGLTIADAMSYGKPVIATAWSGNLDYMTAENSYLVGWTMVELAYDVGPYVKGSRWADPDIHAAALAMRQIVDDPEDAARRARRARFDIISNYSRARAAALIRARFDQLGLLLEKVG